MSSINPPRIAIFPTIKTCLSAASHLSQQLNLALIDATQLHDYDYVLQLTADYIALHNNEKNTRPFYIDFLSGRLTYRRQRASLRYENLVRAMGLKKNSTDRIVDATAGLARDSFILASLGFEITMLERSPIIRVLLSDGLTRAANHIELAPIIQRLTLVSMDAITWFNGLTPAHYPDIIYLDPMYPEKQSSALAKKEMQIFQDIIGHDDDADELLVKALACANKRVVVKRPRKAPTLGGSSPSFSLTGSSSRFDVYLT